MDLKADFATIVAQVRSERPLIHIISNYVTAENCADAALAAGASPIMADSPDEAAEITAAASALVLNLGTISSERILAMEQSAAQAQALGLPVILDPVGVMSSNMRLAFALKLLNAGQITIVRGNLSECQALLAGEADGGGVDACAAVTDAGEALLLAKNAAKKFACIFAVTGSVDYISNGKQALVLNNGHPLLAEITGSGCMTSTLIGCCAAVTENYFSAATLGVVIMGQSAELAANFLEKKDGPGTFKARLMDAIYHVTSKWNVINLNPEKAN